MELLNYVHLELLEKLDEGVYFVDNKRTIQYWNQGSERITGYTKEEVIGKHCIDNIQNHVDENGNNYCQTECPLLKTINTGKSCTMNLFLHHKDGHRVPISMRSFPIKDSNGNILGAVEIFKGTSEKMFDESKMKELARMAYIDPLTGLPNRNFLSMKMETFHKEAEIMNSSTGSILLRVKNHGQIVDEYGEKIAGQALKITAKTLLHNSKQNHLLGRWDDTAFLSLIPGAGEGLLQTLAKKYLRLLEHTTLSIGRTTIPIHPRVKYNLTSAKMSILESVKQIEEIPYSDL